MVHQIYHTINYIRLMGMAEIVETSWIKKPSSLSKALDQKVFPEPSVGTEKLQGGPVVTLTSVNATEELVFPAKSRFITTEIFSSKVNRWTFLHSRYFFSPDDWLLELLGPNENMVQKKQQQHIFQDSSANNRARDNLELIMIRKWFPHHMISNDQWCHHAVRPWCNAYFKNALF